MWGEHLLTTVGDLFTLVAVFSGAIAFMAYQVGRWVGRQEGADERASLRLQLRLATEDLGDEARFVDLADEHGLLDEREVSR